MFLSQKGGNKVDSKKGLGSVKIDSLTVPTHLNTKELLPATLQYRPETKIPTRGETELTREDRHSQHLRKKRTQKVEKKRKDQLLHGLAENNKKLRVKMEKEDALKKLGKNRSVQIIGSSGNDSKSRSSRFNSPAGSKRDDKSSTRSISRK